MAAPGVFAPCEAAEAAGVSISVDSNFAFPELKELLKISNIFIPAKGLACELTGQKNPTEAGKKLLADYQLELVVVTCGTDGSIALTEEEITHAPGFEVDGFGRDHRGRIDAGGEFESTVYRVLEIHVDEIMSGVRPGAVAHQIEIDLVIRCGNNVGLVEAKTGVNKAGIDQLDTAGNPIYLGRYANKFLVTGRYLPRTHKALAMAQGIHVVELPGYSVHHGIPDQEQRRLVQTVHSVLVGR